MKPAAWIAACALLCSTSRPAAAQGKSDEKAPPPPAPVLRACGLEVVAPGLGDPADRGSLVPFGRRPGLRLAVLLLHPTGTIVHFDRLASRIEKLADDKGTDLGAKPAGERGGAQDARFGPFPRIAPDGKGLLFTIETPRRPSRESSRLAAQGELVVMLGRKKKTLQFKDLALQEGIEARAPEMSFTVKRAQRVGDRFEVSLTFRWDREWSPVEELVFTDAGGKSLGAKRTGYMTLLNRYELFLTLDRPADKANVSATLWSELAETRVPFKIETGLGLAGE